MSWDCNFILVIIVGPISFLVCRVSYPVRAFWSFPPVCAFCSPSPVSSCFLFSPPCSFILFAPSLFKPFSCHHNYGAHHTQTCCYFLRGSGNKLPNLFVVFIYDCCNQFSKKELFNCLYQYFHISFEGTDLLRLMFCFKLFIDLIRLMFCSENKEWNGPCRILCFLVILKRLSPLLCVYYVCVYVKPLKGSWGFAFVTFITCMWTNN